MTQSFISGTTKTELYRYLKRNGGSYNDLRICFQNCGIQQDSNVKSVSTTEKDGFLDSYIVPLDPSNQADAQKLVNFIAQAVRFFGSAGELDAAAKPLFDSLTRDGWKSTGNEFVWGTASLLDGHTYVAMPSSAEQILEVIIKGIQRSCKPLRDRRSNASSLSFDNEYDYQDLLHTLLVPWVPDIRREDYVKQYLGTNKRVDFYLPDYSIIIEVKFVRDQAHARKVGDELTIDITHYQQHQGCKQLWIVIVDQRSLLDNPNGLLKDLTGVASSISVRPFLLA